MRFVGVLIIFLAILVSILAGLVYYEIGGIDGLLNKKFKPVEYTAQSENIYENISQFYPNMRYVKSQISYLISDDCNDEKRESIRKALEMLSQRTILTFYQAYNGTEIEYMCSELAPEPDRKNYYIAGEGGPKEIIDSGLFNVILSGKVSLYREEKCDTPNIALHETLHALGFDHNNNPKSILYPVTSCDEIVDDYIINDINELYSTKSLPDLTITKVSVRREGRYISFDIDILNQGLEKTSPVYLSVYSDGSLIKTFDEIEGIGIGYKKLISVENLKIPYSSNFLRFVVTTKDNSNEIDMANNQAIIKINEG